MDIQDRRPVSGRARIKSFIVERAAAKKEWQLRISEEVFTKQVIDMARWFGWRVMHQRPARTKTGWRTAISGDTGFPDLLLLRHNRRIMAELKAARGRVTPEQELWLESAMRADFEVYVWRPADIDEIEGVLR